MDPVKRKALFGLVWCWTGCTGIVGTPTADESASPNGSGSDPIAGDDGTGAGVDSPFGPGGGGGGGSPTPDAAACEAVAFQTATAPIRRLTPSEYQRTVEDLFPEAELPTVNLLSDETVGGFSNNERGQAITDLGVERFVEASEAIGDSLASQFDAWAPCAPDANDETCARTLVESLGFHAYRRPLTPEEQGTLQGFVDQARTAYGLETAGGMLATALLQSPSFLYRPEFGQSGAELSGYEVASRLSYFLWGTMPDDQLFAAAERGDLASEEGVRAEARRMLSDPRAEAQMARFFSEWLDFEDIDELDLDEGLFPENTPALRADLKASLYEYVNHAFWVDDSFESLLAGRYGFVNDRLAPIFGVPAPGTDALTYVELDPSQRRGVLTQPGLLASTSHGIAHSPIFRGVTLLNSVMCTGVPAPPPGVLDQSQNPNAPGVCTTRDRVERAHSGSAECQACHEAIDGAGFALENYDALGRYRTVENGCPVDASGSLPNALGGTEIDGGVELATALAESEQAAYCMTTHWFRYALGRLEASQDQCEIWALTQIARDPEQGLQSLVVALVGTHSFRTLPPPQ